MSEALPFLIASILLNGAAMWYLYKMSRDD